MKTYFIAFVSALLVSLPFPVLATPAVGFAGNYVGVARVTKISQPDNLSIATTIHVVARVDDDGTIVILSAAADASFPTSDVESSITRLTRNAHGIYFAPGNSYVSIGGDGRKRLLISYQNPPVLTQSSPAPSTNINLIAPDQYTKFEITLTRK